VSLTYLPAVGGLEKVMSGLAYKWSKEHEIIVFTKNKSSINDGLYPYKIIRDFSLYALYKTVRTADIYLEANISLYTALVAEIVGSDSRKAIAVAASLGQLNTLGFFAICVVSYIIYCKENLHFYMAIFAYIFTLNLN
jgi:hypothetical protein